MRERPPCERDMERLWCWSLCGNRHEWLWHWNLREEARTTWESGVGANAERWEKPLRHEPATTVLEPLRKEALTNVGASGGLGAPCSGTVDGVNEAGGKGEMEPLWNEATMIASSRHVLERPLWKEATMTAPADVEGCESELSRSVQCRKGFLSAHTTPEKVRRLSSAVSWQRSQSTLNAQQYPYDVHSFGIRTPMPWNVVVPPPNTMEAHRDESQARLNMEV